MPTHCYVPGCKSGYRKDDVGKRHFFTPPKDEKMFLKWSEAIARQDWPFSNKSFVCDLHFGDEFLQKCDTFFIEGKKVELSRRKWILDPTAVPHIFPSPVNARKKRFQIHRKCCVPGCNFGYNTALGLHGFVPSFIFPKNEERKQRWICAIPRKNWLPKLDSSVCAKHFNNEDIIIEESRKLPDGTIRKFALKKPKLKKDAVPCNFFNFPQCLDSQLSDVMDLKNNTTMYSDEHYMDIKSNTREKHQQQEGILNEIKLEQGEFSASYDALQNERVSFSSYFVNDSKDSMYSSENEVKTKAEIKEEPCNPERVSAEMKYHPETPRVSDDHLLNKIQHSASRLDRMDGHYPPTE